MKFAENKGKILYFYLCVWMVCGIIIEEIMKLRGSWGHTGSIEGRNHKCSTHNLKH